MPCYCYPTNKDNKLFQIPLLFPGINCMPVRIAGRIGRIGPLGSGRTATFPSCSSHRPADAAVRAVGRTEDGAPFPFRRRMPFPVCRSPYAVSRVPFLGCRIASNVDTIRAPSAAGKNLPGREIVFPNEIRIFAFRSEPTIRS